MINLDLLDKRYHRLRNRAKKKGVDFKITKPHLRKLMLEKSCPCCGVTLTNQHNSPRQRTIDRLVPTYGYTDYNTGVLCHQCNNTKDSYSIKELYSLGHLKLAIWLEKTIQEREIEELEKVRKAELEPAPKKAVAPKRKKKKAFLDRVADAILMLGLVIRNRKSYAKVLKEDLKVYLKGKR